MLSIMLVQWLIAAQLLQLGSYINDSAARRAEDESTLECDED
jgi:hypothetical protein